MAFPGAITFAPNSVDILVRVLGGQAVSTHMASIERSIQSSANRINSMPAAAANASAAAAGTTGAIAAIISGASLKAYSAFRRAEIGFQSITDNVTGSRLTREMMNFGEASAYSGQQVLRMGQMMLGMGTAADKLMPRLKSTANLVAAIGGGNEEFVRAAIQLSQIQSLGKVTGQDIRALSQSFPIQKVALAAGVQDPMQLSGMSADKFFAAMDKAAARMGDVQGRLSAEDPLIRSANVVERFTNALKPVGGALNRLLQPVFYLAEGAGTLLKKFNEVTLGIPGVILLVKMAWRAVYGFFSLGTSIRAAVTGLGELAVSSRVAAAANGAGAVGAGGRFFASAPGFGFHPEQDFKFAARAAAGQAAKNAAARGVIGRAAAWTGGRLATMLALGGTGPVGWAIDIGLLGWTIYELATMGSRIEDAQKEVDKQMNPQDPARRPHQRSDVENMQSRLSYGY